MLIRSSRQTAADLRLWAELETGDAAVARTGKHLRRIEKCRELIRDFVRVGRPHYVSLSWGKDSVVLADLWLSVEPTAKLVYVRMVDNENPDSLLVRDAFLNSRAGTEYEEVAYSYRNATPDWFDAQGKPRRWQQILDGLRRQYGVHATGIRSDESAKRRRRCAVFGIESANSFAPLAGLNVADVFAHLFAASLPTHPVYAMLGGGRWDRERVRTASLGNEEGRGIGRDEWEREYYGDVLNRLAANKHATNP